MSVENALLDVAKKIIDHMNQIEQDRFLTLNMKDDTYKGLVYSVRDWLQVTAYEVKRVESTLLSNFRQDVKDLTATSEKLRELNSKLTAKALRQHEAIQIWSDIARKNDAGRSVLAEHVRELTDINRQLVAEMEKRPSGLSFPIYIASLEKEVLDLKQQLETAQEVRRVDVGIMQKRIDDLKRQLEQEQAVGSISDREKLRTAFFAIADLVSGHSVTKISMA